MLQLIFKKFRQYTSLHYNKINLGGMNKKVHKPAIVINDSAKNKEQFA